MRLRSTAAAAVLAVLLLLTALASATAWTIEQGHAADRRSRLADRVATRIEDFNARMLLGVEGAQGLYEASDEVSRAEFARYAHNILPQSGLSRLDWIERVPAAHRPEWERRNGVVLQGAGTAGDAYVITYQAPDRTAARLIGADLRRSADRWPAMGLARDTGRVRATGPLQLLDTWERGFVVYAPVYAGGVTPAGAAVRRARLVGYVAGVQRAGAILEYLRANADGDARITVRDGDRTLVSSGTPRAGAEVRSVAFTGRVWTVSVDGGPSPSPMLALMTGLVGLLVSGVTTGLLASSGRRERYAQELLQERMAERDRAEAALLESEERHRLMLETSADPIVTMDGDGVIRSANAAVRTVLRWDPADLVGRSVEVLMPEGQRAVHARHVADRVAGAPARVIGRAREIRALRGDGVQIPVVIALSESMVGGRLLFTGIIHDMTERRAAEDAIRRSEREQGALLSIATAVAANEPEQVVFDRIAEAAAGITGAASATILRDAETGFGRVLGAWAADGRAATRVGDRVPFDAGAVPGRVASGIRIEGRHWGHLVVEGDAAALAGAHGRLERFAAITALAVTSAEARRSLAHLAATDPLTGLWNRRTFAHRLEQELAAARRDGVPLTLVVLDLDEFKQVNDTHGHDVGDEVLVELARRLQATVREGEVLARVGGEEFAWILPRTDGIHGFQAAERARVCVSRDPFGIVGRLTMSAGVCEIAEASDADELFRNADAALYWAKRSGRDRCFRYTREAMDVLAVDERGTPPVP